MKKLVNQVINEMFRQMTITLTLPLDVPVRPMDAKGLRGCVMVLEIVFVGQCEASICLDFVHFLFFPYDREAHRSVNGVSIQVRERGVNSLKKFYFSFTPPLNSMSHLRVCVTVLEIIFVGEC